MPKEKNNQTLTPTENSVKRNFSPQHEAGQIRRRLREFFDRECVAVEQCDAAKYEGAQQAVIEAKSLAGDAELWASYIALPFWSAVGARPKQKDMARALKYTMRMACGGDTKKSSERRLAVEKLLGEGTSVNELAATLKARGGFSGVNRPASKKASSPSRTNTEIKRTLYFNEEPAALRDAPDGQVFWAAIEIKNHKPCVTYFEKIC